MKLLAKPTLIRATIIYLLALLPSILLIPFSIFLYGSSENTTLIVHIFALLSVFFPITLITSVLGSWLTNIYSKNKLTILFLLLPIIHSIFLVVFGLFYFAK